MIYGNVWELGAVQEQPKDPNDPNSPMVKTKVKGKVAAVAMPEHPVLPRRLGPRRDRQEPRTRSWPRSGSRSSPTPSRRRP